MFKWDYLGGGYPKKIMGCFCLRWGGAVFRGGVRTSKKTDNCGKFYAKCYKFITSEAVCYFCSKNCHFKGSYRSEKT